MSDRILTANVVVRNEDDTDIVVLQAGDELPDWAIDQVGEHVFTSVSRPGTDAYKRDTSDVTLVTTEDGAEVSTNHSSDSPEIAEVEDEDLEDADEDDTLPPYEEWNKEDLKAEAKGRELTGYSKLTHEELVELLKVDDAENPED